MATWKDYISNPPPQAVYYPRYTSMYLMYYLGKEKEKKEGKGGGEGMAI